MIDHDSGPEQDDDEAGTRPDGREPGQGRPRPADEEQGIRPDALPDGFPGVGYAEDDPPYDPGGGTRSGGA